MREDIERCIRELYPGNSYDDQSLSEDHVVISKAKARDIFSCITTSLKLKTSFGFPNDYEHCFTAKFSLSDSDPFTLIIRLSQYFPCFFFSFNRPKGHIIDPYTPPSFDWQAILDQVVVQFERQGISNLQPDTGLFEGVPWLNAGHSLMARSNEKVTVFHCLFMEI